MSKQAISTFQKVKNLIKCFYTLYGNFKVTKKFHYGSLNITCKQIISLFSSIRSFPFLQKKLKAEWNLPKFTFALSAKYADRWAMYSLYFDSLSTIYCFMFSCSFIKMFIEIKRTIRNSIFHTSTWILGVVVKKIPLYQSILLSALPCRRKKT